MHKKNKILIFNESGADFLADRVLREIEHDILPQRKMKFISLGIFKFIIKNIFLIFQNICFFKIPQHRYIILGNIRRLYLLACINEIAPKAVITFVDNDYDFQWLSRHCSSCIFIAIQNGVREGYDLSKWLPAPPHPASKIYLPTYFCFGEYEIDLYRRYCHQVANFYPIGSIRSSYFFNKIFSHSIDTECKSICLISQWASDEQIKDSLWPEFYIAFQKLCEFLKNFQSQNRINLVVALRGKCLDEKIFFNKIFDKNISLIENDAMLMTSYKIVASSSVIITIDSTLGREAFSWGKRVLFCNLSDDQNYDCPCEGIWSLNNADQSEFNERLNLIMSMEIVEYRKLSLNCASYLMKNPIEIDGIKVIRNYLLSKI